MQRGALKIVCYLNWKVLLFNVQLSEPKDEIRKWPSRLDELERESSPTNWHRAYKIALAINCICHFLVLVLVLPQTTSVLRVYNVYSTWVVWSENRAKIIASAKVLCSSHLSWPTYDHNLISIFDLWSLISPTWSWFKNTCWEVHRRSRTTKQAAGILQPRFLIFLYFCNQQHHFLWGKPLFEMCWF